MGKIGYQELDKKVYMFAKANYDNGAIKNLYYEHDPDINTLNKMYDYYKSKVKRNVEGFIIANNNNVNKYVRMKNGKLEDHHE